MMACNFDWTVNEDDGSCTYPQEGYDCDGNCIETFTVIMDCLCLDYQTLTTWTDFDETSCTTYENCACECNNDINDNGVCDEEESGCTDSAACNFDITSNLDDNSCVYAEEGYDCDGNALVFTQTTTLDSGWNLWSTYITPSDMSVSSVFESIVDQVVIVKNQFGAVYWPAYNLNSVGNLTEGWGYQVKMTSDATLDISGDIVPSDFVLSLNEGWGMLGYLNQDCFNTIDMMGGLSSLEILKDEYGNVYWPEFGLNSIGNMCPGTAYQIKTSEASSFSYPSGGRFGFIDVTPVAKTVHYTKPMNTGNNMTIGLPMTAWEVSPSIGDEIAAYDESDKLIGSTVFNGDNLALTIWGDDLTTTNKDGLATGEKITLKLWNSDMKTESTLVINKWDQGGDSYTVDGISIASNIGLLSSSSAYKLYQNEPNPFNGTTTIKFYVPEDAEVSIGVYNMLGEYVAQVTKDAFTTGKHSVTFSSSDLGQGTYFVKMTTNGFTATKNMNIVR